MSYQVEEFFQSRKKATLTYNFLSISPLVPEYCRTTQEICEANPIRNKLGGRKMINDYKDSKGVNHQSKDYSIHQNIVHLNINSKPEHLCVEVEIINMKEINNNESGK
uniref:Uncharacterized protein n=1 Tax=Glossina pallidipes TaxID=7398 RepID=A0A1B0AFF6_GLOPL